MHEEALTGGNMTQVVRVGDTVRRSAGRWTPTVHALLGHLRERGFQRAPEPLGMDESGREVLSLLAGAAARYPLPDYALSDATLREVFAMVREYHEATVDFPLPAGASWQWPAREPFEVICHNDIAPYNTMFVAGRPSGLIDFDTASPGPRRWDLGYAAYRFVPLTDPANPDVPYHGVAEQRRRLALAVTAYGSTDIQPAKVLRAAIDKLCALVAFIKAEAAAGDPAQLAVLERGDTDIYQRDIRYLVEHTDQLAAG
ncbi:phosphotransferase family enzyme [Tamaricihabitans halophyticus]|uniref:Phosphotransferase family enzyme n=1 Tax=Tamaricihabitans halophyticus TaxID=1262583 RepID=A0A4R2QDF5_9PSEU|nr:aminoglycoside phosphotransferase family protein [Tamaricihabitans halophyticus]TCP46268.1 phosphotransferase family enzyme [Tamaricihabitans halophyticus]